MLVFGWKENEIDMVEFGANTLQISFQDRWQFMLVSYRLCLSLRIRKYTCYLTVTIFSFESLHGT
jgi:hypothetical protein